MQVIPLIAMAASAAMQATQSMAAGKAQQRQANYLAQVAANDASQARMQASYQADRIRDENLRISSSQRAAYLKNRISPSSGSAWDVMRDSEIQGELNALSALYTGAVEANRETARAQVLRTSGRESMAAARFQAAGTLIGGAGQAMSSVASSMNPSFMSR